ncbi:hypothetical protein [Komarekiella delphini-convector]|nr:hypothetical protein [Komarekiella delphini-convector]
MNYVLVFRPEVQEEFNEAYSWYENLTLQSSGQTKAAMPLHCVFEAF